MHIKNFNNNTLLNSFYVLFLYTHAEKKNLIVTLNNKKLKWKTALLISIDTLDTIVKQTKQTDTPTIECLGLEDFPSMLNRFFSRIKIKSINQEWKLKYD